MVAQVEQAPALASQNTQAPGFRLQARIEFARQQLDERGFARSVGTQNSDVLALRDGKGDAIERDAVAALHRDVIKIEERCGVGQAPIVTDSMVPTEGSMQRDTAKACKLVERSTGYHGKQGLDYFAGVSAETTGSQGLCLHRVTIPPLARARPHLHERHESAVYVLSGQA